MCFWVSFCEVFGCVIIHRISYVMVRGLHISIFSAASGEQGMSLQRTGHCMRISQLSLALIINMVVVYGNCY